MPTSVPTSAASSAPSSTSSVGDGSTEASSMPIANVAQTSSSLETGSPRSPVQGNVLVTPSGPATASLRNQSTAHLAEDGSSTAVSASASASVPQGERSETSSPEHRVLNRVKRSANSTSTTTELLSTAESSTASTVELTSSSSSSSTGVSSSTTGSSSSTTTNTATITSAAVAAQQSTSSNSTNGTTATLSPSSRPASTLSLNTTRSSSLPVSSAPATSPLLNTTSSGLLPTSSTGAPISSAAAIGVGVATGFIGVAMFIGLVYWCYAKYQEYRIHRGREATLRWRSLHPRRYQPHAAESVVEMQPLSATNFLATQGGFSPLGNNNFDPRLVAFINVLERQARQDEAQGGRDGNNKKKKGAKDDKSKKKH